MNEYSLSSSQIEAFHRDGVLVLREVVSLETRERLANLLSGVVDDLAREMFASGDLSDLFEDSPFELRWAKIRSEAPSTAPQVWRRVLVTPEFYSLWLEPALLAAAKSLLGANLRAYDRFNGRPREPQATGQSIAWHQDAFNVDGWSPDDGPVLTAWVPLVPVDETNGCLSVVRGSHMNGLLGMETDEFGITHLRDRISEVSGDPQPLNPGDALLFGDLTLHRSLENKSAAVRWSVDIRYSADTAAHRAKSPGGFRVSGENFEPESYEEWSDKWKGTNPVMGRQLRRLDLYAASLGKFSRDVRNF